MSDQFDPYHKWLGIPPRDQPPHHYRLLGIELFEQDREVIDSAANRLMAYLKELAVGDDTGLSQKLLNEVAAARLCLLNAKKRRVYDDQLRQSLAPAEEPPVEAKAEPPVPAPPQQPTESAVDGSFRKIQAKPHGVQPARPTGGHASRSGSRRRAQKPPTVMIAAVTAVSLVVIAIVFLLVMSPGGSRSSPSRTGGDRESVRPRIGGGSGGTRASLPDSDRPPAGMARLALICPARDRTGVAVLIDGEQQTRPAQTATTHLAYDLAPGEHTVLIRWPDGVHFERRLVLEADRQQQVSVSRASPGPLASLPENAVNLLARIDPQLYSRTGLWNKTAADLLVSPAGEVDRIDVPYAPPDEYDLVAVVERTSGQNELGLGLIAAGRKFAVAIGADPESGGVIRIEASDADAAESAARPGRLPEGGHATVRCAIRTSGLTVSLDDREVFSAAAADLTRCGVGELTRSTSPRLLSLAARGRTQYVVHQLYVVPFDGGETRDPAEAGTVALNEHRYRAFFEPVGRDEAIGFCRWMGGRLASAETVEDREGIATLCRGRPLWQGTNDEPAESAQPERVYRGFLCDWDSVESATTGVRLLPEPELCLIGDDESFVDSGPQTILCDLSRHGRHAVAEGCRLQRDAEMATDVVHLTGVNSRIWLDPGRCPQVANSPLTVRACIRPEKPHGILLAHGNARGGYVFFLRDGKPAFQLAASGREITLTAPDPLPAGWVEVAAQLDSQQRLSLWIEGRPVAQRDDAFLLDANPADSLTIGADEDFDLMALPGQRFFTGSLAWLTLYANDVPLDAASQTGPGLVGKKQPQPDAAAQQAAQSSLTGSPFWIAVQEAHAAETLAERLDKLAEEVPDPVQRYVACRLIVQRAAQLESAATALRAIDAIDAEFEVDALAMKSVILTRMSESSKHSASIGQLAQAAGGLLDDLLHADRLDLALQLVDAVYKAVASEDAQTRKDWFQRRSEVQAAHLRWQEYRKAVAQLETMPDDPQANLLVGRRMCFVLGQWDRGLMHLASGSDDALRQLADADLNSGDDLDAAQTVGDQWRAAAGQGNREPAEQLSMLRRCREHLSRALEMSRGTDREKEIDDRLQAVDQQQAALEAAGSGDASASEAQFALEFDGQDDALVTNLRYDGSLPITIEAIVKPAAFGGFVVGNNDQSGVGIALDSQLRRWAWVCRSKTPNQFVLCYSDDEAVLGRWVHLAGVYAGGAIAFFVDGKLQGQVKQIGAHLPSKQTFLVGANPRPDGKPELFFHGAVRELRVSATPLYRRDFTPPKTLDRGQPTVLLYRLNEGQGATAVDTSGNRWDGQVLGAQWVKLPE